MARFFLFSCGFLLLTAGSPARAAWHEASSEHFVIRADQSASTVQLFAERLEKFHAAMAFMLKQEPESPSPSNRVTVFVVSNTAKVRKLADLKSKYTAGIYMPRAGNIVAIVPRLRSGGGKFDLSPETILKHEYAHHFLFNITNRTFPLWFQEGFAEFFASGREERDGTTVLGGAANHRAYELAASREVPIERLLDTENYLTNKSSGYDQFYGRSWLLYHFMTFDESRQGQMAEFQRLMANGSTDIEAAREAFGDLDDLDTELDRYASQRRISAVGLPSRLLKTSPVTVRRLPEGEAKMMPILMESRTGVDEDQAAEILADARRIAAEYPDDPAVQEALAEAEFDAGYDVEAIAAADRALALDDHRIRAQIQKIYAYAHRAESAADQDAAWKDVRKQIVVANRLEPNNPVPLMEYYRSYRWTGATPPKIAIDGLKRALQLAPFDHNLRMTLAAQFMQEKLFSDAAITLRPLAYNPHRSGATEAAEELLKLAEKAEEEARKVGSAGEGVSTAGAASTKARDVQE